MTQPSEDAVVASASSTTPDTPTVTATPESPVAKEQIPGADEPLTLRALFEAGVHFGHPTRRWNPKMRNFIYTDRAGSHIIDLTKTLASIERACAFVRDVVSKGGNCVFVGTKKQAQEPIEHEARRCGAMFINQRWLGGMMTNFQTIQQRIDHLVRLEEAFAKGEVQATTKREAQRISHEVERLNKYLGGIKEMTRLPDVLFVVDIVEEKIAIAEARKLGIPVVAMVDTDSDPTQVQHPIPGNDDGVRSIHLIASRIANAIIDGRDLGRRLEEERLADEAELEAQEAAARARAQAEAAARLAQSVTVVTETESTGDKQPTGAEADTPTGESGAVEGETASAGVTEPAGPETVAAQQGADAGIEAQTPETPQTKPSEDTDGKAKADTAATVANPVAQEPAEGEKKSPSDAEEGSKTGE